MCLCKKPCGTEKSWGSGQVDNERLIRGLPENRHKYRNNSCNAQTLLPYLVAPEYGTAFLGGTVPPASEVRNLHDRYSYGRASSE